jgi:hypothetical protein
MAAIIDSYSESNAGQPFSLCSSYAKMGHCFTNPSTAVLDSVKFYLGKNGTITGNAVVKLYAVTGSVGSTATPTGAALATSDNVDVSLFGSAALKLFNFSGANRITLAAATAYFIVAEYGGGNTSNYVAFWTDQTSPTHAGNFAYYDASWHADAGTDACFYIYKESADMSGNLLLLGVG